MTQMSPLVERRRLQRYAATDAEREKEAMRHQLDYYSEQLRVLEAQCGLTRRRHEEPGA